MIIRRVRLKNKESNLRPMANLVERETENKPALIIVNGHRVRGRDPDTGGRLITSLIINNKKNNNTYREISNDTVWICSGEFLT